MSEKISLSAADVKRWISEIQATKSVPLTSISVPLTTWLLFLQDWICSDDGCLENALSLEAQLIDTCVDIWERILREGAVSDCLLATAAALTIGAIGHHPRFAQHGDITDSQIRLLRSLSRPLVSGKLRIYARVERVVLTMLCCFDALPTSHDVYCYEAIAAAESFLARATTGVSNDASTVDCSALRAALWLLDRVLSTHSGRIASQAHISRAYANSELPVVPHHTTGTEFAETPWPSSVLSLLLCRASARVRNTVLLLKRRQRPHGDATDGVCESDTPLADIRRGKYVAATVLDTLLKCCVVPNEFLGSLAVVQSAAAQIAPDERDVASKTTTPRGSYCSKTRLEVPGALQAAAAAALQPGGGEHSRLEMLLSFMADADPRNAARGITLFAFIVRLAGVKLLVPIAVPSQKRSDRRDGVEVKHDDGSSARSRTRSVQTDKALLRRWQDCIAAMKDAAYMCQAASRTTMTHHAPLLRDENTTESQIPTPLMLHIAIGVLNDLASSAYPGLRITVQRAWRYIAEVASAVYCDNSNVNGSAATSTVLLPRAFHAAFVHAVVAAEAITQRWRPVQRAADSSSACILTSVNALEQVRAEYLASLLLSEKSSSVVQERSLVPATQRIFCDPSTLVRQSAWITARYAAECFGPETLFAHFALMLAPVILPLVTVEAVMPPHTNASCTGRCTCCHAVEWLCALAPSSATHATSVEENVQQRSSARAIILKPFAEQWGAGDRPHCLSGGVVNDITADEGATDLGVLPCMTPLQFVTRPNTGDGTADSPVALFIGVTRILIGCGRPLMTPLELDAALSSAVGTLAKEVCHESTNTIHASVHNTHLSTPRLAATVWMATLNGVAAAACLVASESAVLDERSRSHVSACFAGLRAWISCQVHLMQGIWLQFMKTAISRVRTDCFAQHRGGHAAEAVFDALVGSAHTWKEATGSAPREQPDAPVSGYPIVTRDTDAVRHEDMVDTCNVDSDSQATALLTGALESQAAVE